MRIALTGHRPERLGYPELNQPPLKNKWLKIVHWLMDKIEEENVIDVYCGMADGCDIAYGIAAIISRHVFKKPIKLHCILPCKDYNKENGWYEILKEEADEWVELSDEFYKGCDNVRDQYMIDHCDKLIAIWDGNKSGGVWSTIRKAQKKGLEIIYYPRELL